MRLSLALPVCALLLGACTGAGTSAEQAPAADDRPAHHDPAGGFRNLHIEDPDKGLLNVLRMRFGGNPPWADHAATAGEVPVQAVDPSRLRNPAVRQLTWLGHSSMLLQTGGRTVLFDPVFSDIVSPLPFAGPRRYIAHAMDYADLPPIDLVVISHDHYDHLDVASIRRLATHADGRAHFAVPLGLDHHLRAAGVPEQRIAVFDWHDSRRLTGIDVTALPSQHWSRRGLFDTRATLWASWLVTVDGYRTWFAGDTGYNPVQFRAIGEAHAGIDLALIPIGAYAPRWFMQPYHVNPEEALRIHADVGAALSVGMHWGTFPLTAEPPMEPPTRLASARLAAGVDPAAFRTLAVGETLELAAPEQAQR